MSEERGGGGSGDRPACRLTGSGGTVDARRRRRGRRPPRTEARSKSNEGLGPVVMRDLSPPKQKPTSFTVCN